MRTRSLALALMAGLAIVVSACSSPASPGAGGGKTLKIGMVTDVGTLDDKSFNEASWKGTQDGASQTGSPAPQNIVTKTPNLTNMYPKPEAVPL